MANQKAIASTMMGVCESVRYAEKAGLDPETVLQSIETGAAGSWSLSNLAIVMASQLTPPANHRLKEFSDNREAMAAEVNRVISARPDLEKLVGADGKSMSEDNNRNFSLFMESLMGHFQAEVLVDTALWVFRAYRAHGFQTVYWPANLNAWMQTLKQTISPEAFREISPFYAWLITHIPDFVNLTDEMVNSGALTSESQPSH